MCCLVAGWLVGESDPILSAGYAAALLMSITVIEY
jgi:hypothetical protein